MGKSVQAKDVMPWLLVGGAAFVFFKLGDKFFGKSADQKFLEETSKTVKQEIQKQIDGGVTPSYSDAQYKTLADTLQNAMGGPGTDESKVFQAINMMKNATDILKLVDAFGNRNYGTPWFGDNLNLGQWFREEFDADGMFLINKRLASNGIKFQF